MKTPVSTEVLSWVDYVNRILDKNVITARDLTPSTSCQRTRQITVGTPVSIWQYSIPEALDFLVTYIRIFGWHGDPSNPTDGIDTSGFCELQWVKDKQPSSQQYPAEAINNQSVLFKLEANHVYTLNLIRDPDATGTFTPASINTQAEVRGFTVRTGILSSLPEMRILQVQKYVSAQGPAIITSSQQGF